MVREREADKMYEISKGLPILGCHLQERGANFGLFSNEAKKMRLNIYENYNDIEPIVSVELDREKNSTGHIFHIHIKEIKEKMAYEWQILKAYGWSGSLIDPYAYSLKKIEELNGHYRGIITSLEPYSHPKPYIPWEDTIIYEMHVGAFTKHISSKVNYPGTFLGLKEKLPYLKSLGITTIELLPIFKWNKNAVKHKHPITGEKMQDIWGYNPISLFALQDEYSQDQNPLGEIKEFKELVDKIHDMEMEVILDVVYNHTGEGGKDGDTFHFKALGKKTYYRLNKDEYMNCSGTGNTLNTSHLVVKQMILDSLRYWIVYMGIDGFRFDLASILGQNEEGRWTQESLIKDIAEDPIISKVKLISESWDAKGSYDVGKMPYPFTEWSDFFRDTIRKFVRGDMGIIQDVNKCIMGEDIEHRDSRKTHLNTIHFVTAHDGFTLWDVVSYCKKHNDLNGENNQDGNNTNYSENCGIEGESLNLDILNLRKRKIKNYMILLLLSRGIPMILMGDEAGRTQKGNNNAYCQDNELLWMDWKRGEEFRGIKDLIRELISLRNTFKRLQEEKEYLVSWHDTAYNEPDLSYYSRSIACHIQGDTKEYYIIINNYIEELTFQLPRSENGWEVMINTYEQDGKEIQKENYKIKPFSICILKQNR